MSLNLKQLIKKIVGDFISATQNAGIETPFIPEVIIKNTPQLIYYEDKILVAPEWSGCTSGEVMIFDTWAKDAGGKFTGEQYFKINFNWFLAAHELGHYIQAIQNDNMTNWDAELNANKIAVAFWKLQGEQATLDTVIGWSQMVWKTLENPVPAGDDPEKYFNDNYEKLSSYPNAYGYFQFMFYKMAYDSDPVFNKLVQPKN